MYRVQDVVLGYNIMPSRPANVQAIKPRERQETGRRTPWKASEGRARDKHVGPTAPRTRVPLPRPPISVSRLGQARLLGLSICGRRAPDCPTSSACIRSGQAILGRHA
jgi:hypothetical protein